jgi:hypothetical protein
MASASLTNPAYASSHSPRAGGSSSQLGLALSDLGPACHHHGVEHRSLASVFLQLFPLRRETSRAEITSKPRLLYALSVVRCSSRALSCRGVKGVCAHDMFCVEDNVRRASNKAAAHKEGRPKLQCSSVAMGAPSVTDPALFRSSITSAAQIPKCEAFARPLAPRHALRPVGPTCVSDPLRRLLNLRLLV